MTEEIRTTHKIPSDMEQIPVVWRYELLKYLRSKRIIASLAIVIAILGLMYIVPFALGESYSNTTSEKFAANFLSHSSFLVIICATFFAGDSIVSEFQNRTGYWIFPNPIKREIILFGKYFASLTAGSLVIGLFYAGTAVLSFVSTGGVDGDFGLSFLLCIEYLIAATAVAYVISSLFKSATAALVMTFFMFIMFLPIVDGVSMIASVKIEGSLTFAAGAIMYILYDPYPVDSTMQMGDMTLSEYYPDPAMAAIVMMAYAAVAMALTLIMFKRKQLAG